MIIREYKESDWKEIERIGEAHDFPIPVRKNIITEATVVDGNNIVGYGIVQAMAEAVLILNLEQSKKLRSGALSLLMRQAIKGSSLAGFDQIHGFFKNPNFADSMQKHYGFEDPKGRALVLEID